MLAYPTEITDPVYIKKESLSIFQQFLKHFIKDPRDLPFLQLIVSLHLTVIPLAVLLYLPVLEGYWWWAVAIPYFYISQFYFKGSFGLMLHCLCHRNMWKPNWQWVQKYILWFLSPFFGHLGESYNSHHIGMHHIAGNLPEDSSSTMAYQRDSLKDFIRYWLNFMLMGFLDTYQYLFRRKLKKYYVPLTWSEFLFILFAIVMCFVNLKATMVIFVIPFFFARLVMMLGNWTQHAFVDPDQPGDELASTLICINTVYNHKCWNDGYHAFHHFKPSVHYTEYPLMLEKYKKQLAEKRTFIFSGVHYLHIFTWLMTRNYEKLADHLVNLNGTFKSKEDAIELLKARVKKFENLVKDKTVQEEIMVN
ncbi:fatty acid desaturase family protein [Shivajiella indica]|uniref:Fatty acid desaturase family protein n=1 Tax=Shivajiella indica TaxID=872115 RepID=A0ABW5B6E1_9BACT